MQVAQRAQPGSPFSRPPDPHIRLSPNGQLLLHLLILLGLVELVFQNSNVVAGVLGFVVETLNQAVDVALAAGRGEGNNRAL